MDEEKGRGSRASDAGGSIVGQKSHVPPTSHKMLSRRTKIYALIAASIVLILIITIPTAILTTQSSSSSSSSSDKLSTPATPLPTSAETLRILPLGDSLTHGIGSSALTSYRLPLQKLLFANSTSHVFVGRAKSGGSSMDNPEHEGYERVLIADLEPMVSGHLAPLKPDVVLLHVGTNDCANNYQTSTMQRYGKLLDMILAELPGVPVLVGTMMKAWVKDTESCLQGFNTKLKELVEGDEYRERKVMLVDMGGVKEEVMVDFLHPNDNGYGVMAEAWYDAIEEARRRGWVRSLAADE